MGIAVIIPNVNFQDTNLGKVTLQQGVPLRSMTIVGPDEITEPTPFTVNFFPANTSQRGIVWSIVSGATYASINAETGELTPIVGAVVNDVVIRATSTADNTIYAEKTVSVSYGMVYLERRGLVGDGDAIIATGYIPKRNTRLVFDYKFNSYPEATTTPKYITIWGAYTAEDAPATRHLIMYRSSPPDTFVRQNISFGRGTAGSTTSGISVFNYSNYTGVNIRVKEEVGMDDFAVSYAQGEWVKNDYGEFYAPLIGIHLFGFTYSTYVADLTVFGFKAYEGDTLALDLVPCTLLSNISGNSSWDGNTHNAGENGLWDKVGKKFYGNAKNTGSFTIID